MAQHLKTATAAAVVAVRGKFEIFLERFAYKIS